MANPPAPAPRGTLLVIDDEPQIRRAVRNTLATEFARVIEAASGSAGVDRAAAERPNFVVLDLGLPDGAGIAVCRELRKWLDAPILVLSARHADAEKVALLDAGANDYLTKPFGVQELAARIRVLLRSERDADDAEPLELGGLRIDTVRRTVLRMASRSR